MRQAILALSLLVFGLCQVGALAFCPTGYPNEIFCDDFETYCEGGGYPVPEQPRCTETDRTGGKVWVQRVWYQTSGFDSGEGCGTTMTLEDNPLTILDGVTSGRFYGKIDLGQQTIRDWVASELNPPDEPVLNIQRFIGNVFGSQYGAVTGTDSEPLVMEFLTGANVGKLYFTGGYMEVALGDHTNNLNRANTDYAKWPKSYCCGGTVLKGPWPVICAQGNADPAVDPTAGCPSVETDPPPVHNAIAVGALPVLDANPCHCDKPATEARPRNDRLALFDGQLWWTLKTNSPVSSTGTVAPINGAPMPEPSDIVAGDFVLSSRGTLEESPYNAIKLTIKETTIKVELISHLKSEMNGAHYIVTSVMDNIPRKYVGPFDRIRSGVGPGCELSPNMGWATCKSAEGRSCLATPDGWFVDFDNYVLHGGVGVELEGACCNAVDGSCSMTVQSACSGLWTKSLQTCEGTICCPAIYGDTNGDGSVDMTDFAVLQTCITTGGGTMDPACACFDSDGDEAIGSAEILNFADCAKGPGIPGDSSGSCAGRGW